MSCIAYFEEWSNIFRNRSFSLCKNDRDFSETFDSATVSESHIIIIDDNLIGLLGELLSTHRGLTVVAPNISPDFHS